MPIKVTVPTKHTDGVFMSVDKIKDVYIIEPKAFGDERGYFMESFNKQDLVDNGIINTDIEFIQDNESSSSYGVIRGLHLQMPPYNQAKIVRVVNGKVLDVIVDVRPWSKTFGQYVAVELSDENKRQLYVPHYFAHGFAVLSPKARFLYKVDAPYNKQSEFGLSYNDKQIGINWQALTGIPADKIITSEKDRMANTLKDLQLKLGQNGR
jgi:dTDP-4-dehydrorhamnose 3,5-epimerase